MTKPVEDVLRDLISRHLSVDPRIVTPAASLVHDLGADSLDLAELTMAVEEAFEIEISDEDAAAIRTVADALRLIAEKRSPART